jgi:hypothetical protein
LYEYTRKAIQFSNTLQSIDRQVALVEKKQGGGFLRALIELSEERAPSIRSFFN